GNNQYDAEGHLHVLRKREESHLSKGQTIAYGILIPVLVLLSGVFAGLMLGYMSLDETQLHVLSISGTPKQKEYAKKIQPIRKNGHLLLITLILANMIVNETLPVIADPVLGGGVPGVIVSTVLIVIFSEIIPQSVCTRYGLAIGAHAAWFVRILILVLGIISWPVAKFMEIILGPHHGIMYRRAELKELIALHATTGSLGGDLKKDTVNIIGATLDLQEKVVRQAMTPIDDVFMLSIEDKLDKETLKRIYDSGHSRVPVYEDVEVPVVNEDGEPVLEKGKKVKKILGVLLVKQCLLLDPNEATPLRHLRLAPLPFVPSNEPLLAILDRFQEGRSHMAVISRYSVERSEEIKHEVKKSLRRRLKERIGADDSSSSSDSTGSDDSDTGASDDEHNVDKDATLRGDKPKEKKKRRWGKKGRKSKEDEAEKGEGSTEKPPAGEDKDKEEVKGPVNITWERIRSIGREQSLPDDAVPPKENMKEFLQSFDPAVAPLGIITLEDVLEELIGEEIYDEFDTENKARLSHYVPNRRGRARPKAPSEPTLVPTAGASTTATS
ncbi:DUF21-domain-containing protein, partial [Panus rudis PR-1116 ss-1]